SEFMTFTHWLGNVSTRRSAARRARKAPPPLRRALESLEERASPTSVWRSLDGTGNNLANANWGATGADLVRLAPAAYGDGVSTPAGANRPSARVVSNTVSAHPADEIKNNRGMSNFVYAWGQFIDHDLDLTSAASPRQAFNVAV